MARFTHVISTIDSHTAGEPTRLVVSGLPPLRGDTMADKMLYARQELDAIRRLLMLEPRGRQDLYGALLTVPSDPAADFGLIFMNTRQYTTMRGHAVIGAATTVVETGMVQAVGPETRVVFDTPVGLVATRVHIQDGGVVEVNFSSTPVFVFQLDAAVSDVEPQPDGALLARNVATFGDRTIDRSPCGTGTCARMAVLYAGGALEIGQRFVSESIIGTRFVGHIVEETRVGAFQAVVPEVAGRAYVTGFHQFVLDPHDPFPHGFSLISAV